jgi:hypothetical protein
MTKRRKKFQAVVKVGKNREVAVTIFPDQGTMDISIPNHERIGFYQKHIKGITEAEGNAILSCLLTLKKEMGDSPEEE